MEKIQTLHSTVSHVHQMSVVSLFSGCGGLDLGFTGHFHSLGQFYPKNPFRIIWANEADTQAADTYTEYFRHAVVCKPIEKVENHELPPYADVVIGGFPCKDFSLSGKRQGLTVERGRLYLQMKRIIDQLRPKFFVAENVKNLLLMENGQVMKTIVSDFESSGYRVYHHLYHAADYGVPQNRERVILVGVRDDLAITPFAAKETHSKEARITAFEAIEDLWGREEDPSLHNHAMISRCRFVKGRKTQGNVRIKANRISPTIRAEHHGNIEGHYKGTEDDVSTWRRLSVRECARLQTFPDDFKFKRTATAAYKQVGNAVPPVLAWHIARSLALSPCQSK